MNTKLLKKYTALTVAAGYVGVGHSEIIVTDHSYSGSGVDSYDIDINGDGIDDFQIATQLIGTSGLTVIYNLNIVANDVMTSSASFVYAYNLSSGALIDATGAFDSVSYAILNGASFLGNFVGGNQTGYIGVKTRDLSSSNFHYGWIRISFDGNTNWTVHESGYECFPEEGILAGEEVNEDTEIDVSLTIDGITLTSNETSMLASYQWVDCDNGNAPVVGATDASFTPSISGNFAVEITVGTCTKLSECTSVNLVSTSVNQKEIISIYPNPVKGQLLINASTEFTSLQVFDLSGRQLISEQFRNNQALNVAHLSKGVYFIRLNSDNQSVEQKFIKE